MNQLYSYDIRPYEQDAERRTLAVIRYANCTDCLRAYHLAPAIAAEDAEGKSITIRGSDLCNKGLWKKFLTSTHQTTPHQLTHVAEQLAAQFKNWLLTQYTERYRAIATEGDLAWLEEVILLVTVRHIMEAKYDGYIHQHKDTFADPQIAVEMTMLMAYHDWEKETPRLIHHIIKEPEQAQTLIKQFYDGYDQLLKTRVQPPLFLGEPGSKGAGEEEKHE